MSWEYEMVSWIARDLQSENLIETSQEWDSFKEFLEDSVEQYFMDNGKA